MCVVQGQNKWTCRFVLHTIPFYAERQAGKLWILFFSCLVWIDKGKELRSTGCETDAPTTMPSRRLDVKTQAVYQSWWPSLTKDQLTDQAHAHVLKTKHAARTKKIKHHLYEQAKFVFGIFLQNTREFCRRNANVGSKLLFVWYGKLIFTTKFVKLMQKAAYGRRVSNIDHTLAPLSSCVCWFHSWTRCLSSWKRHLMLISWWGQWVYLSEEAQSN